MSVMEDGMDRRAATIARRTRRFGFFAAMTLCAGLMTTAVLAQSSAASLAGTIVDPSGAILPGASVTVANVATGISRTVTTNADGQFAFPSLVPGQYTVTATLAGFQTATKSITLNIGSVETIRVQLSLAGIGERVEVTAEAERVSTSPSVSTVVDRTFVENLPISGRSFQSLLQLTPGVTLFAANTNPLAGGQFSVNGQRTNANYFTVDGVSANANMTTGTGSFSGHSAAGSLPALSALGTTQSLVSVDALEEFRVQTSTYAPEYGRMPGAQVQMVTRAGTNKFTGSGAWYFRDDSMDAIDYFAELNRLPKAKLSQNNFSTVVGGPLVRRKTFFFFSYEGLRLDLPQTYIGGVPTEGLKASATPALRELLNAFPQANGPVLSQDIAQFATTYEDPSSLDATAFRVDHTAGSFTFFGRYNHAPSVATTRSSSRNTITESAYDNDSITGGVTWVKGNVVNDLRGNWTDTRATQYRSFDASFPGTSLPAEEVMFPGRLTEFNSFFLLQLTGTGGFGFGTGNDNFQRQVNIVDTLTWVKGSHTLKFGGDFRRISPILNRAGSDFSNVGMGPVTNVPLGLVQFVQIARGNGTEVIPTFDNFSAFAQDTWTFNPRLTFTYGLRYELNPAPGSANDTYPQVMRDITAPLVEFEPEGTRLYHTRYGNIAPRVGVAYALSQRNGWETVVRGGVGNFYDTGFGVAAIAYDHIFPYFLSKTVGNAPSVPYPLTDEQAAAPDPNTVLPQQFWQMDHNVRTPYTLQWNTSVEQSLGRNQSLSVTYVGSTGKDLLRRESWNVFLADYVSLFPTTRVFTSLTKNGGRANYHSLQLQFQRRLSSGFQALAYYTLSSSKDTTSSDDGFRDGTAQQGQIDLEREYAPSDYDVRHTYSIGATYSIPSFGSGVVRAILGGWGVDGILRGRSAFPMSPLISNVFGPVNQTVRPNLVPGQPIFLTGAACPGLCPGGWAVNRAAFTAPAANTTGDFPRNSIRGFDAWQADMSLRRSFRMPHETQLQFKFEVFNITNHVNFADPVMTLSSATFGIPTQMLNRGLGSLNPLYQMGGPRSAQASLKFTF